MSAWKSLQYTVRIQTPVIMSRTGSDQNLVASLDHLRGRAILGCLASRYIRAYGSSFKSGDAQNDQGFHRLFLSTTVRFCDLLPVREDPDTQSYVVFSPVPLSLQARKHSDEIFNLLEKGQDERDDVPTKPLGGYAALQGETARMISVQKQIRFHNARSVVSESRPRARAEGHTTEGGIFNYEAIAPGELFWGEIWGDAGDLQTLKGFMEQNPQASLGRSRTAQYGTVEIHVVGITDLDHKNLRDTYASILSVSDLEDDELVLMFVSPAILLDACGNPSISADAVCAAVNDILHGGSVEPEPRSCFLRPAMAESYVGVWQMKTPRMPAIDAGSVLRLRIGGGLTTEQRNALLNIEKSGIGSRTNEGYGQVVVLLNDDDMQDITGKDAWQKKPEVTRPDNEPPAILHSIIQHIWDTRIAAHIEEVARRDAFEWKGKVSSSLLAKLEAIVLHASSMHEACKCLEKETVTNDECSGKTGVLKKIAMEQLEHCHNSNGQSLRDALLGKPFDSAENSIYSSSEIDLFRQLRKECGIPEPDDRDKWHRLYWAKLLKALRKGNQKEAD